MDIVFKMWMDVVLKIVDRYCLKMWMDIVKKCGWILLKMWMDIVVNVMLTYQ